MAGPVLCQTMSQIFVVATSISLKSEAESCVYDAITGVATLVRHLQTMSVLRNRHDGKAMNQINLMLAAASLTLLAPETAAAMCGCMMPIDDTGIPESTQLISDATQVVMLRHGTKTIQTMQNRYEGPIENFAIVIPTPEVLTEESVKVLYPEVFANIDRVSAPRLTEYWQHDPCEQVDGFGSVDSAAGEDRDVNNANGGSGAPPADPGVVVEAEFQVGEYQIQVLSAEQGVGLEIWLTENGYRIPSGAATYLQPYIDAGMYFFVAKVDASKVNFVDDRAQLSPLRFHYDTPDFTLPTRLGMLNSAGRQDLVVYALGETRFEAANLPNATIPTNVAVVESVKNDFAGFYDQMFEKTLDAHGKAVITEYASWAWEVPYEDLVNLGGDVVMDLTGEQHLNQMVLTRLHFRYEKDDQGEDVVFRAADPIAGGQEAWSDRGTVDPRLMEQGVMENGGNQFRAHYFIKHEWSGEVNCSNPSFDRWGGPLDGDGSAPTVVTALNPNTTNVDVFLAAGKRDIPVSGLIEEDVPEIGLKRELPPKNDVGCSAAGAAMPGGLLLLIVAFFGRVRRRSAM